MFTNEQNMGLLQRARVKKTVYEMETDWLSGKGKVQGAVVGKESHCLLEYERTLKTVDFL